jgi:hypothetical protein
MDGKTQLLVLALVPLSLACATSTDVRIAATDDFSGQPTWNWAPHNEPNVVAQHRDLTGVEQQLEAAVERVLEERGFRRAQGRADFYASYHLGLRRRDVVVVVPFASRTVSSYHHSGTYVVEGSERIVRSFEEASLLIGFAKRGEPLAWHAALQQRVEGVFDDELSLAVTRALESFPYYVPSGVPAHVPFERLERLPEQVPCLLTQSVGQDPGAVGESAHDLASLVSDAALYASPEACPKS